MRIWIAAALLVAGLGPVNAERSEISAEQLEPCNKISEVASAIMAMRQSGSPMSDVMPMVGPDPASEALVVDAYATPAGMTQAEQERATNDFRDKAYLECYRSKRGKLSP